MSKNIKIDYHNLMDLRVDYAFKQLFTKGDPRLLISLINAIFSNKKMKRVIKSLDIKNPYMDKESAEDKLSILDIRAELQDGTNILIEMHLHGLGELKAKTIRSWARAYGEDLTFGKDYKSQTPTIAIAFSDGQIRPLHSSSDNNKIHRICMITDIEDNIIFTDAMELHYIDMKAFAETVNEKGSINIKEEPLFSKWLSVITQKEIENKDIVKNAVKDEEEIFMAMSSLALQGEDKYVRQAYQRRKDEIFYYKKEQAEFAQTKVEFAQTKAENIELRKEIERLKAELASK
jgi:predicted transposase/invertase (TIGR01784 family)